MWFQDLKKKKDVNREHWLLKTVWDEGEPSLPNEYAFSWKQRMCGKGTLCTAGGIVNGNSH